MIFNCFNVRTPHWLVPSCVGCCWTYWMENTWQPNVSFSVLAPSKSTRLSKGPRVEIHLHANTTNSRQDTPGSEASVVSKTVETIITFFSGHSELVSRCLFTYAAVTTHHYDSFLSADWWWVGSVRWWWWGRFFPAAVNNCIKGLRAHRNGEFAAEHPNNKREGTRKLRKAEGRSRLR